VDGGVGIDTVSYENSWDRVVVNLAMGTGKYGEASRDVLVNVENLIGSRFNDILTGDAGVNRLNGGAGDDILDGGAGNDILVGGAGADTLIGGDGNRDAASYQDAALGVIVNLALGGTGGEAAGDTYSGVEYVYGSAFADQITGDGAINRLTGGAGDDILDGAAGNDYILGDAGNDTLIGGLGADVFVFEKGFGNDTISDFWAGAGRTDRVWLTGLGFDDFDDVLDNAVDTVDGVVITIAGEGTLTFTGVKLAQLNADDFIFS
jgi:Ca2+-binding RTX toxin-like protein